MEEQKQEEIRLTREQKSRLNKVYGYLSQGMLEDYYTVTDNGTLNLRSGVMKNIKFKYEGDFKEESKLAVFTNLKGIVNILNPVITYGAN